MRYEVFGTHSGKCSSRMRSGIIGHALIRGRDARKLLVLQRCSSFAMAGYAA